MVWLVMVPSSTLLRSARIQNPENLSAYTPATVQLNGPMTNATGRKSPPPLPSESNADILPPSPIDQFLLTLTRSEVLPKIHFLNK